MSLGLTRTYTDDGLPIWQDVPKTLQGGFKLVTTGLNTDNLVKAGTPVLVSETARTATVLKTARAQANATNSATDYRVEKGHHFAVGDYFAATVGSKAYAITAITTTETDYDTITIGTTLGAAVTAGDIFFKSSAAGASAAALDVTPNALVKESVTVETNQTVSAAYSGRIYQRRTTGIPSAIKTSIPQIFVSESY